jgi:hypothetical protein
MPKFRKKPVVIEAIRFTRAHWEDVKKFTNGEAHSLVLKGENCLNLSDWVNLSDFEYTCIIPTLEGQHIATEGDWIIKGVNGEFYPCKPDIFEKTYELV